MRIALDAMGSDNCPVPDVAGAVLAARKLEDTIYLIGDKAAISAELAVHDTDGLPLEVVHADEAVMPADKPSIVAKGKPDSSMHVGMRMVRNGEADAFVTVGNTGAALTIATLYTLRRIRGVKRPALGAPVQIADHMVILLDIGANTESRPEWLSQFALMGDIYARRAFGFQQPRVALLSNGEEEGKGTYAIQEAALDLKNAPLNYIGYVEPSEVLLGEADVVVCDGFSGNIMVKTFEASLTTLSSMIRDELKHNVLSILGGALARPAFSRVRSQFDIGGALLLGVNGVVAIGHGGSDPISVRNAIFQAHSAVTGQVVNFIQNGLELVRD